MIQNNNYEKHSEGIKETRQQIDDIFLIFPENRH